MKIEDYANIKTANDVLALPWQVVTQSELKRGDKGIYMVMDKTGTVLYIGKSVNIRTRLAHRDHPLHGIISSAVIKVHFVANKELRGYCEYLFIEILKPKLNRRRGQVVHSRVPEDIATAAYKKLFH